MLSAEEPVSGGASPLVSDEAISKNYKHSNLSVQSDQIKTQDGSRDELQEEQQDEGYLNEIFMSIFTPGITHKVPAPIP